MVVDLVAEDKDENGLAMARRFASGDSSGPKVTNLQLKFWLLAVDTFDDIIDKWKKYAVDEEEPEPDYDYTENDFLIDAAVALVLAGTSVSELIGQNVPPVSNKTPHLRPAYKTLLKKNEIPDGVESFFTIYDCLRHFGEAKHQAVYDITQESLCEHLKTAQSIWKDVLKVRNAKINDEFMNSFRFPE